MPVRYNGIEFKPAPLVDITKQSIRDDKENIVYSEYTITLTGTIVNVGDSSVDSPNISGSTFGNMDNILKAQKYIRNAFADDGKRLEIEAPNGGGPNTFDAYCTVEAINFARTTGNWTFLCDYVVTLKTRKVEGDDEISELVTNTVDRWSITENPDGTYGISHQVEARGLPYYGASGVANSPLTEAKTWVSNRKVVLDSDGNFSYNDPAYGSLDFSSSLFGFASGLNTNFWNYALVENIDPESYFWGINENFIYDASGVARESFTISVNGDRSDFRRSTVSVNGSVIGNANTVSNTGLKNTRASGYFASTVVPNIYSRALPYILDGHTLNPVPVTKQITYQLSQGTIDYQYVYDVTVGTVFDGALSEEIRITDVGPNDVFATIQVPGRTSGPVIQNMNTKTSPQRTVDISIVYAPASGITAASLPHLYAAKPNTDDVVTSLQPNDGYFYVTGDSENWNPISKQYSRSTTWLLDYQIADSTPSGVPNTINNLP